MFYDNVFKIKIYLENIHFVEGPNIFSSFQDYSKG